MPESMDEIRRKITSNDVDVLVQSLEFARRCLLRESERGQAAETRATIMLGVLGVVATLAITGTVALPKESSPSDREGLLLVCFVACLLFLAKALFYAILTIGVSRKYTLMPHRVFNWQQTHRRSALQSEIAGTIWEYDRSIDINSARLFRLQRCQRSSYVSIFVLVCCGVLSIEFIDAWIIFPKPALFTLAATFVILLIFLDRILDEWQGLWRH